MVGDWPGFYASYCAPDSLVADHFAVCAYPVGPTGRSLSYGGSHTFGLTFDGAARPEALTLLRFLTAPAQQLPEARAGSVPVRRSVMATILLEASPASRQRWATLEAVLHDGLLIPPKFAGYPRIEEMFWQTVQSAMTGHTTIDDALEHMTAELHKS
jgi:multiple sugar transport system substrate-binding protein